MVCDYKIPHELGKVQSDLFGLKASLGEHKIKGIKLFTRMLNKLPDDLFKCPPKSDSLTKTRIQERKEKFNALLKTILKDASSIE